MPGDRPQIFEARFLGELAKACEAPDWFLPGIWARGAWVGSKERPLFLTPAMFERKVKGRLGELRPL